jgi:hypothetical protein
VESEISKPIFPFQRDLISERMLAPLHRGASLQCFVRSGDSGTFEKDLRDAEIDAFSWSVAEQAQSCKPTYFSFGGPSQSFENR